MDYGFASRQTRRSGESTLRSVGRLLMHLVGVLLAAILLTACDPQNIRELEEGFSTEADVRARFGDPENIWDAPQGARIFEYNRQPAGYQNYMITIGTDGKLAALRQVLVPQTFSLIVPGMMMEEVRRTLGKPMRVTRFALTGQTHYDWRYRDGPNVSDARIFSVVFDNDLRVVSTGSIDDLDAHRSERR